MSATWVQAHIRHPWFNSFTTKRKVCRSDSDEDESSDMPRPVKRRRCSTLERGFAHLSLTHDSAMSRKTDNVEDVEMPMESDSPAAFTPEVNTAVFPSSLEQLAPVIKDVKMRTSTWYEPEPNRIVVTELESSSDEEADTREGGEFYVSPVLLDCIRSRTLGPNFKPPSQALVLYRPMPQIVTACEDASAKANAITPIKISTKKEEDAMDLEP